MRLMSVGIAIIKTKPDSVTKGLHKTEIYRSKKVCVGYFLDIHMLQQSL